MDGTQPPSDVDHDLHDFQASRRNHHLRAEAACQNAKGVHTRALGACQCSRRRYRQKLTLKESTTGSLVAATPGWSRRACTARRGPAVATNKMWSRRPYWLALLPLCLANSSVCAACTIKDSLFLQCPLANTGQHASSDQRGHLQISHTRFVFSTNKENVPNHHHIVPFLVW